MTDQTFRFPRFFVTAPSPCPYLPGRTERKVFTELTGSNSSELNDALGRIGFRRSQNIAYVPYCEGCQACVSVRVVVNEFKSNRSMRRSWVRNSKLAARRTASFALGTQLMAEATGGSVAAAPRASAVAKSEHDAKRSAGRRAIAIAITGSRSARSGRSSASRGTTPLTR